MLEFAWSRDGRQEIASNYIRVHQDGVTWWTDERGKQLLALVRVHNETGKAITLELAAGMSITYWPTIPFPGEGRVLLPILE